VILCVLSSFSITRRRRVNRTLERGNALRSHQRTECTELALMDPTIVAAGFVVALALVYFLLFGRAPKGAAAAPPCFAQRPLRDWEFGFSFCHALCPLIHSLAS
jgi:hypothetical protein